MTTNSPTDLSKCNCLCHFNKKPTVEESAVSSYYGCEHCKVEPTVEPKSIVVGYEPTNKNNILARSYEHIKVQPILDNIQANPTVDKWDTTMTAVDPYKYAEIDREAFLNKYGEAGKRFLQREVQEAKAERDREIVKICEDMKMTRPKELGIESDGTIESHNQALTNLISTLNTKASLKQEEEK